MSTIKEAQNVIRVQTDKTVDKIIEAIRDNGSYRVANELRNSVNIVLRGQRSGRYYRIPYSIRYNWKNKTATITYKTYRASAPGEPPAIRTGLFRMMWQPRVDVVEMGGNDMAVHSMITNKLKVRGKPLGDILEYGTQRMKPRPYKQRTIDGAMPKIKRIYSNLV